MLTNNWLSRVLNEEGNQINMTICDTERGITIYAVGPTSDVEHTWTPLEARMMYALLTDVFKHSENEVLREPHVPTP